MVDSTTGGDLSQILQAQMRARGEALSRWDLQAVGRERSQQAWHWFGCGERGVIAGLCELLDRHLARPRGRFQPAALGCVPWFNHIGVAQRLAAMPSCVVINKPKGRISAAALAFHNRGQQVESEWFLGLHDLAPIQPDGGPRIVGPGDRIGSSLGPLRVYGHRQRDGEVSPLLHTKMLVLGGTYEDDEYFSGVHFLPDVVWLGSANWTTEAEGLHTEAAVAVADRSFVKDATRYVSDIIGQSEAVERYAPTPRPDLASSQLDMQAFADYAAEFYLDQPDDDLTAPTYGC